MCDHFLAKLGAPNKILYEKIKKIEFRIIDS